MEQRGQELRRAIDRIRRDRVRWRCPAGLRSEVVAYVHERRKGGAMLADVAREFGVSESSLGRWVSAERGEDTGQARLREVKVVEPASGRGVTLVTPRGYRIEGLDVESAARLLQAL